jgi:alkanesulfonate monooxygenase SsuD/methylene tetrahydromethanopterin reductase-like flavin-dependent oxidoreductase (luciferase family)
VRSSELDGPRFSQSAQLEPLSLAASLMSQLRGIGLVAALPMAYWEPYNTARAFAALDNLSAGRAGWLAIPASSPADAANFPRFAHQRIETPYERALEYNELVRALWDSWEDDALKFDKANAIFTDRAKVHRIAHQKKYFTSDGPLNAPRPVQGHPPVFVSDISAEGLAFAAVAADVVIATPATAPQALALRAQINAAPLLLASLDFVLGKSDSEAAAARAQLDALAGDHRRAGLQFTGTPEALTALMTEWFVKGCCDGFQLLPAVMPRDLASFADDVVPLLRARGIFQGARDHATLRDRLGLARPPGRTITAQGAA